MPKPNRYFLLSPADCSGRRARMLMRAEAEFELARRVRAADATIGEVFAFLSALYFRGKLAYAQRFARPARGVPGVFVITPDRGLLLPDAKIGLTEMRSFSEVPIDLKDPRYRTPFERDAAALAAQCRMNAEIVLLGSVATNKYVNIAATAFGPRLRYPTDFAGRGDMSRGGLLLRSVREEAELVYEPIAGALGVSAEIRRRRSGN